MLASFLQPFSYMIWDQRQQRRPQIPTLEITGTALSRIGTRRCVRDESGDRVEHLRTGQSRADAFVGVVFLLADLRFRVLNEDLHHIVNELPKCPGCHFAEQRRFRINP